MLRSIILINIFHLKYINKMNLTVSCDSNNLFPSCGSLIVYYGPMFSGKTTKGLTVLSEFIMAHRTAFQLKYGLYPPEEKKLALYINHSNDNRSNNGFSTHHPFISQIKQHIDSVPTTDLSNINVTNYSYIMIDEAQFFNELVSQVKKWVEIYHCHVIVVGLSGDINKNKFGKILDLLPIADKSEQLSAHCIKCMEESLIGNNNSTRMINAPFTFRFSEEKEQTVVGGADKYIPVCRYHHQLLSRNINC